jgi:hypothetical protein
MPTTYYKVHGGRLSFTEYWRMSPDPFTFLIASVAKLFGGFPMNFSIPRPEELTYVDWDDVPPVARKQFRHPVEELEGVGFELAFCYELPLLEKDRMGAACALLGPEGKTFATVVYCQDKATKQRETSVVSRFDDDTFGVTTTAKKQLKPLPTHLSERYPGAPADELYDKHIDHLKDWTADGRRIQKITRKTLPEVILEGEQATIDFHIERGVFVPMTRAEIRKIRAAQEDEESDEEE